jgi:hypothetical protein
MSADHCLVFWFLYVNICDIFFQVICNYLSLDAQMSGIYQEPFLLLLFQSSEEENWPSAKGCCHSWYWWLGETLAKAAGLPLFPSMWGQKECWYYIYGLQLHTGPEALEVTWCGTHSKKFYISVVVRAIFLQLPLL